MNDEWLKSHYNNLLVFFFFFPLQTDTGDSGSLVNKQQLSSYRNNTTWGKLFGPHTIIHRLKVGVVCFPIPSGGWWYFCQGQGSV